MSKRECETKAIRGAVTEREKKQHLACNAAKLIAAALQCLGYTSYLLSIEW